MVPDPRREQVRAALDAFERQALDTADVRHAAVAVTLVLDDEDRLCFLLTRRASTLRSHTGQWALPGGRLDEAESPVDAALRELHEELGLELGADDVLGILDDYATRSGYVMTPVVLWAGSLASRPLVPDPSEVAKVYAIPVADIDVEPRFVDIPESDQPVIQLPILRNYMHAPTAAIIYQFREVALHGRATRVAHLEQPLFAWR